MRLAVLTAFAVFTLSGAQVEYVGGSTKSIPLNTSGTLEAMTGSGVHFQYGKSAYDVPYSKIIRTDVGSTEGRRLWKVPVPHLVPAKAPKLLTITYREGETGSGSVTFRAAASTITELADQIELQRKAPKTAALKTGGNTATGLDWWGDNYWRTNRNKTKWPSDTEAPGGGIK